jgi:hypothetical protein
MSTKVSIPRKYSQTSIYKLCCKDVAITEIYVGHTTNFRCRKSRHKSACTNESDVGYNIYVYQFIRDNGGWDNWDMVEIIRIDCADKREAETSERYYMESLRAKLNKSIPTRTSKEYREDNRDSISESRKEHYNNNIDRISESKKEHYNNNRDRILETIREYNIKNKERIAIYQKEYKLRKKAEAELAKSI